MFLITNSLIIQLYLPKPSTYFCLISNRKSFSIKPKLTKNEKIIIYSIIHYG